MKMETDKVYFAVKDRLLTFKYKGAMRLADTRGICLGMEKLLDKLFDDPDFDHIVIDLTEMESIDSTHLGVLARIARFSQCQFSRRPIIISNSNQILEILESVSFDSIFHIASNLEGSAIEGIEVEELDGDDLRLLRVVLETHRELMRLSQKNRELFKTVEEVTESQMRFSTNTEPDQL